MTVTSSTGKLASYFYGLDQTHRDCTTQLPLNEWCYVAVTYNGVAIKYYINGGLDKSYAVSGNIVQTQTNSVDIGMEVHNNYGRNINGLIKYPKIYNRALSESEIKQIYLKELNQ